MATPTVALALALAQARAQARATYSENDSSHRGGLAADTAVTSSEVDDAEPPYDTADSEQNTPS